MQAQAIEQTDSQVETLLYFPAGEIVAENLTEQQFMEQYIDHHAEWVRGYVIKMSPVQAYHDRMNRYLEFLLSTYLAYRPIGVLFQDPFVMRLRPDVIREPDLMVVLNEHKARLLPTMVKGAADLCIEVVSPESSERDRVEKLYEYQKGGVREYWIIDPPKQEALFYRLNANKTYDRITPEPADVYESAVLPGLKLNIPTLWAETLPGPTQIVKTVAEMLGETS